MGCGPSTPAVAASAPATAPAAAPARPPQAAEPNVATTPVPPAQTAVDVAPASAASSPADVAVAVTAAITAPAAASPTPDANATDASAQPAAVVPAGDGTDVTAAASVAASERVDTRLDAAAAAASPPAAAIVDATATATTTTATSDDTAVAAPEAAPEAAAIAGDAGPSAMTYSSMNLSGPALNRALSSASALADVHDVDALLKQGASVHHADKARGRPLCCPCCPLSHPHRAFMARAVADCAPAELDGAVSCVLQRPAARRGGPHPPQRVRERRQRHRPLAAVPRGARWPRRRRAVTA
jgi:hypothetical protein